MGAGIVAALIFGVVLLFLMARFVLRLKPGSRLNQQMVKGEIARRGTPPRLHLESWPSLPLAHAAEMEALADALLARGFIDAGLWRAQEIPEAAIRFLCHPAHALTAALYEHQISGFWVEYLAAYTDGSRLSASNSPHAGTLDWPPTTQRLARPGGEPLALLDECVGALTSAPRVPASPETVAAQYEQAYAALTDWRNQRGGATAEEIQRVAARAGRTPSQEAVVKVRYNQQTRAATGLTVPLTEAFEAASGLSAMELDALLRRLVVVHDQMTVEAMTALFEPWHLLFEQAGLEPATELARLAAQQIAPRDVIDRFVAGLPESLRFRRLSHVTQPVPADVYEGPAER